MDCLVIKTQHEDTRSLRAVSTDNNDKVQSYYIQFVPYDLDPQNPEQNRAAQTVLPPAGKNGTMRSYDFTLKRGLYHIVIETVKEIDRSKTPPVISYPETRYVYPDPVMAGDKYTIEVKIENAVCYGKNGIRVRMLSREHNLGPRDIYYRIKGEGDTSEIKYYVPFKNTDRIDFFVKGIEPDHIEIISDNPGYSIRIRNS